ncbi:hypothetical protein [Erwinia amylovora]|uniref:hypothetical protein n=1 Tax=Erwinia amylovora TaxID=552 RepID=UPI0014439C40|nr:hypothetical protein [Erwinia amylovora]
MRTVIPGVKTSGSPAPVTVVRCCGVNRELPPDNIGPERYRRHVQGARADWPIDRVSERLLRRVILSRRSSPGAYGQSTLTRQCPASASGQSELIH